MTTYLSKTMIKQQVQSSELNIGFQIAPMIDVVFVIMLFFMVMAGRVQVERGLNLKLPGIPGHPNTDVVDDTQIRVLENGEVLLNDEQVGAPEDGRLAGLATTMKKLKEVSEASQGKVMVTILADEFSQYQRVVDVLNALAVARIGNVTFEVPPQ